MLSCQRSGRFGTKALPFLIQVDCKCDKKKSSESMGSIQCGTISLQYTKGIQAHSGPLTETEKFALAFKGKYHTVFFEKLHIDEKLYKMFIDSVDIVQVIPMSESSSKPFIPCTACNYMAELEFRKRSFSYPFFTTQDTENQEDDFSVKLDGEFQRKFYVTHDGLGSGIYFKHTNKKKQEQNLSIEVQNVCDTAMVRKVLNSISYPKK